MNKQIALQILAFAAAPVLFAQGQPQPPQPPAAPQAGQQAPQPPQGPPPPRANRPPMERMMGPGPGAQGRWWNNPDEAQRLGLNSDQQKRMDEIFQQNRLRLIELNARLQTEEVTLEPLMASDTPDEAKILAQIDKVAQARAELEKANARFLVGLRKILTPDQYKKLQAGRGGPGGPRPGDGPGGPGGPGGRMGGPGGPGGPRGGGPGRR